MIRGVVKEEDKDNSTLLVAMEEIIRMSTPPAKGSRLSRTGKLKNVVGIQETLKKPIVRRSSCKSKATCTSSHVQWCVSRVLYFVMFVWNPAALCRELSPDALAMLKPLSWQGEAAAKLLS